MRMQVESIHSFEQEDADDYTLEVLAVHGDDEAVVRIDMNTMDVVRLYQLMRKAHIGEYVATMEEAEASYKRGEGPNGEPRGTWEELREDPDVRYMADIVRKAMKESS